jgi:hypothetical protein
MDRLDLPFASPSTTATSRGLDVPSLRVFASLAFALSDRIARRSANPDGRFIERSAPFLSIATASRASRSRYHESVRIRTAQQRK